MAKGRSLQRVLASGKEKEKKYDWLGAVKLYEKALGLVSETDFLKFGQLQEKVGYAFCRAAMQAENAEQFRERMRQAVSNYEEAKKFYTGLSGSGKMPRMLRCDAMVAYLGYWLTAEVPKKKRLIDECWRLTKEALGAFEETGDVWEYGKTFNQLSISALSGFFLDWDVQARQKIMMAGIEHGEKAMKFLSTLEDPFELARAYVRTATYLQMSGFYFLNLDQRQRYYQKAADYWRKANKFSEEIAMIELLNSFGMATLEGDWGWGSDKAVTNFKKALEYGRKTRDRFIVGVALSWLAFNVSLKLGERILDPDEGVRFLNTALQYAEEAKHQFFPISFISPLYGALWVEAPLAEYYWDLAAWETSLTKRRELLEKAKQAASDQLKRAKDSGYPEVIMFAHMECSVILFSLAIMEPNSGEKQGLLERALEHRNKAVRINEQFIPFFFWYRGFNQNYLAGIKFELATLAKDIESKKDMLQETIRDKENSLKLCVEHTKFWERQGVISSLFPALGAWQFGYGDLLNRLYEFTNNREHLKKAVKAFEEAAESFQKFNLASRIAECYWKAARVYDKLGQHLKAAESFDLASSNYRTAAENIPGLKDFYQDHASYMEAWNEIEKARYYHTRQEYGQAKKHYEKATELHKSSKSWKYLASNYLAWAQLEHGEDLSRNEQSQEAIQAFQKAAELFREAKRTLQVESDKIKNADEKDLASSLVKASDVREEYCLGRITLEEAKILDRKGDNTASSKKYGSAAETMQKIAEAESEQSRKELQPIIYLCQAWQKMMLAEAKASSTIYGEAAELFKQAKEHTLDQPTSLLALANSSFCKALEAGTRFEATGDTTLYSAATQHLASAANYYVRAGFKTASEYAKGTQRLFDAYVYMDNAKKETDPEKKTRYYMTAEKVLQTSADSFMKAKHREKSEEVGRLLESVKEERELAMSLTEVLHAPKIVSTTTSFSTPTPTQEKAVGLERFEHANLQARLTASEEATIGEELEVRLDLVNVAKNFGLLVRADNLAPPSFKVTAMPSQYSIENGSINMKGKKLEPLKVESIKLSLQATEAGVIELSPQVVYVDEVGKFETCRPEPVTVTVHPKLTFEFKTKSAQSVFDFLISSFVEDYMRRRISLEKSGWRTLMQIIKQAKVSKSSVYGVRGRRGPAISELERRGLVETRVFPGERGRGGRILKMRISYEKETIKRHIDHRIMKIKEK